MGVQPMIKQRKIAKYVLLQIVTLGIYGLFFWSDWTEDLNKMCKDDDNESANYILVFILDIFSLGIYSFIWNYTQAERMYRIAPKYGIALKHGGSYVLLLRTILFFLPVIGSVERIKAFNTLAVAYNATLTEEEILAAQLAEQQEKEKNSKKAKKQAKAEKKLAKKEAKTAKNAEKSEKKASKLSKKTENITPVEEEKIIPTDAVTLPGLTDDKMPDITAHASEPSAEVLTVEETAPAEFEAPQFEKIEVPEPVKPDVEIPAVEDIANVLIANELEENVVATEGISFAEPEFETIDTASAVDFAEPEFETIDTASAVDFAEPVYEIADIEIPDLDFSDAASFETPAEPEIEFSEPAAYEISTDIPEVSFIDDEELTPTSKEEILKQATKTVGTKRTVKEKVAKEPAAKKTTKETTKKATKETAEKATKSTKAKKDTATKSTTKKTTAKKSTTKKAAPAEKAKVEELTFGEVEFEEVDLGADILSEIAEISKK